MSCFYVLSSASGMNVTVMRFSHGCLRSCYMDTDVVKQFSKEIESPALPFEMA